MLHRFTRLVRVIDPRIASNRHALVLASAAFVVGGLLSAGRIEGGLGSAWRLAAAVVLGWAIARELDPDRQASATATAFGVVPVSYWLGLPDLVVTAVVLLCARLLSRSVGPAPTLLDVAGLVGLGAVAGLRPGGWGVALVLAFAVARDRTLPGEPIPFGRLAALLVAALATGLAVVSATPGWAGASAGEWVFAVGALAAGLFTHNRQPLSPTDVGGLVLLGSRLASARRLGLVACAAAVVTAGGAGITAVGPALVAYLMVFAAQRVPTARDRVGAREAHG